MGEDLLALRFVLEAFKDCTRYRVLRIIPISEGLADQYTIDLMSVRSKDPQLWIMSIPTDSNPSRMTDEYYELPSDIYDHYTDEELVIISRRAVELAPIDWSERTYQFYRSYSEIARVWSQNSYCVRRKVGAIIVKDRMIISDGFNGTVSGFDNVCELTDGTTDPRVLHAEANAITKLAKSSNSGNHSTLYVTCSPCMDCAKLIVQTGIKAVFFSELYRDVSGVQLLLDAGVEVYYVTTNNHVGVTNI